MSGEPPGTRATRSIIPSAAPLAVATLALLLLVAAFGPALAPLGGPDRAAAADCAWQRHSKRVVKQVRRDGKPRRVVRTRRWWTCDPVPAPPLGPAPVSAPAPSPEPPAPAPLPQPEPETAPNRVSVKALEFSYTLSRPSVLAGDVTVDLNNQGEDPHNLHLEREGGGEPALELAETEPGQSRSAHFQLAAGKYRLWCSLESHDEWGMNAELVVAP